MENIIPVEREIDGTTYEVTQFQGRKCFLHYMALVNIIGEPLAHGLIAAVAIKNEDGESPVDYIKKESLLDEDMKNYIPAVAEALATLTQKLSPQDALKLFEELLKNTMIKTPTSRAIDFDIDFGGGRMKRLFKLFFFVLEVNFADFLPDGIDLMKAVKNVATTAVVEK